MPPSTERKLKIQFRKYLHPGYVQNACIDPDVPNSVAREADLNEIFIVRVDLTHGGHYWFSNRRVLHEDSDGLRELLRYTAVQQVHWMFKNGFSDPRVLAEGANFKGKYYDRLEIEVEDGLVVMEGLGQAYLPVLNFLRWIDD